jgi:hypothetical protein
MARATRASPYRYAGSYATGVGEDSLNTRKCGHPVKYAYRPYEDTSDQSCSSDEPRASRSSSEERCDELSGDHRPGTSSPVSGCADSTGIPLLRPHYDPFTCGNTLAIVSASQSQASACGISTVVLSSPLFRSYSSHT